MLTEIREQCLLGEPEIRLNCFVDINKRMSNKITTAIQKRPLTTEEEAKIIDLSENMIELLDEISSDKGRKKYQWPASMTDAEVSAHPACNVIREANDDLDDCRAAKSKSKCARNVEGTLEKKIGKYNSEPPKNIAARFKSVCGLSDMMKKMKNLKRSR